MAETILPDLSLVWAQGGDVLKPSDAKIQQGWTAEIPPRQWFNWLDQRQDQAIQHIVQHGISVWSPSIEYQAGKSFVQGSDGMVYKAITTNTNVNPVGGTVGNWQNAFLTADQAIQVATAAQSRAMSANNVYLSPLQLANAFTATNQNLSSNGFQKFPGGYMRVWGVSGTTDNNGYVTVNFEAFSEIFSIVATHRGTNSAMVAEMESDRTLSSTRFRILDPAGQAQFPRRVSYQIDGRWN